MWKLASGRWDIFNVGLGRVEAHLGFVRLNLICLINELGFSLKYHSTITLSKLLQKKKNVLTKVPYDQSLYNKIDNQNM